jgi:hypothetical protein
MALSLVTLFSKNVEAQGIPQNIPRKELLILENPEGTIKNAGWFNIWAINSGSQTNGLQQAALDTFGTSIRRKASMAPGIILWLPTSRSTMPTLPKCASNSAKAFSGVTV